MPFFNPCDEKRYERVRAMQLQLVSGVRVLLPVIHRLHRVQPAVQTCLPSLQPSSPTGQHRRSQQVSHHSLQLP
jgi:hypothetical protein